MRPEYPFIVVALFLLLSGCTQPNEQMTQDKAVALVKEHMQVQYPGSTTDVFNVASQDGSWKMTSKVIYGANTPCPDLSIVVYEYPKFGFVPRDQNNITQDCQLLGCKDIPVCKITMPEEAIIASHKLNNVSEVDSFVNNFGYSNVRVDAAFYDNYFEPKTNSTYPSVWVVRWSSLNADYLIKLILNQSGGKVIDKFIE
ncbi:MAG: hypothetical protein NT130_05110 [Candidatus Micrarchaeota archaeon]|nr:hypothetical protein [Candidatus Micrarchaeota archaeon]